MEEGPVQDQMDVPPGLLEEFFNSAGWDNFVTTTHDLCNELSILSELEDGEGLSLSTYLDIARVQYEVTKATIWRTSLPALIKKLNLPQAILQEVIVQVCLAATGDEVGLRGLTGVIHEDLGYQVVFLDYTPPEIIGGQVIDALSKDPVPGAEVWMGSISTTTMDNGYFFFSREDDLIDTFIVTHPDYNSTEVGFTSGGMDHIRLRFISLVPRDPDVGDDVGDCIVDGSRPSTDLDPGDVCSIVKWLSYELQRKKTKAFLPHFHQC
jgi:hypothetical protein